MFKKIPLFFLLLNLIFACNSENNFEKATDPLDGGRSFLQHYLQGDIKKAQLYLLKDASNDAYFKQMSDQYFSLDKEGRSQLRQASLQINEISAVDSTITIINYQISVDQKAHKLKMVQSPDGWKVDLKYSYGPNL